MSTSMPESGAHAATPPGQGPSVRAQILATEHWSLLATRSMTWSEVMSRIVIHLTVLSAALVRRWWYWPRSPGARIGCGGCLRSTEGRLSFDRGLPAASALPCRLRHPD
jgi:hypothetical protein